MNRLDFGKLIASLRKEHFDESGAPWTQAKLAQEANGAAGAQIFSEHIIGFIERGDRKLDERTLRALGTALQLTSGERKEFFLASCGVENADIAREDNDPEEVLAHLMRRMESAYLPSYIVDPYFDIVAVSSAMIQLLDLESAGMIPRGQSSTPFPNNLVRVMFSGSAQGNEHLRNLMGDDWPNMLYESVRLFRVLSLRYRATEYFESLIRELKKSRLFRRYWENVYLEEQDHYVDSLRISSNSPLWGMLAWFHSSFTALSAAGELLLCMYVPATSTTARVFEEIGERSGTSAPLRFPCWPVKRLPSLQ